MSFKLYVESKRGEYWIDETGTAHYADGDIGDVNHEGMVISMVQHRLASEAEEILDLEGPKAYGDRANNWSDEEHIDWDSFLLDLGKTYMNELIKKYPKKKNNIKKSYRDDPEQIQNLAWKKIKAKDEDIACASDFLDAREYAMKNWNWKCYREGYIDTWLLRKSDLEIIVNGVAEIWHENGGNEDNLNKTYFEINVMSSRKNFKFNYLQMQNYLKGKVNPSDVGVSNGNPQQPQQDYLSDIPSQNLKHAELDNINPVYKRPGVNPFGDWIQRNQKPIND